MLRRLKIFLVCVLSVMLIACSDKNDGVFHDVQGNLVKLSQLQGKWVIVNYWAAWCEGCIKEIPELNDFNKARGDDVVIYGINFDQPDLDALKQSIEKAHIKFPVLTQDPGVAWHLDDVSVLPTTFIINPKGKVVQKILGTSTQASLSAALKKAKDAL
jgi:peroxiredoxin